jgi:hypothetical protein
MARITQIKTYNKDNILILKRKKEILSNKKNSKSTHAVWRPIVPLGPGRAVLFARAHPQTASFGPERRFRSFEILEITHYACGFKIAQALL